MRTRPPPPPPQQGYSVRQHVVRVVRVARVLHVWLSIFTRRHTNSFSAFRTLCASQNLFLNSFRTPRTFHVSLVTNDVSVDKGILLVRGTAWDGAPGGRLQAIMRDTPHKDQGCVRDFFHDYDHLPGVVGELRRLPDDSPTHFPAVPLILLSRFQDNLYVVCLHIPAQLKSTSA